MRNHPRTLRAARWWVARAKAWHVATAFLAAIAALSGALTVLVVLTQNRNAPADQYLTGPHRSLRIWLASARALFGVDAFPRQEGINGVWILACYQNVPRHTVGREHRKRV